MFFVCFTKDALSEAATPTTKGKDALIPCKKTKSGSNLSYQWSRGTSLSPLSANPELKGRVSVTGNGALLINRFTKKDHGKYVCVIKSGNELLQEVPVDVDDQCEFLATLGVFRCMYAGTPKKIFFFNLICLHALELGKNVHLM